jgi:nucleoside phosphorylase
MSERRALAINEYTVGWVCALPLEMAAAEGMLDEFHQNLQEQDKSDTNCYTLGQVNDHNIAIASLPAGVYGLTSAATVAKDMLRTFPSIRFGLLVGIGGAVPAPPPPHQDIRLGDVVVSQPYGTSGGVVQFDLGEIAEEGKFHRIGSLNKPPTVLLTAVSRLRADHQRNDSKIPFFLAGMLKRNPKMKAEYRFQGRKCDRLYQATHDHNKPNETCEQCGTQQLVEREPRKDTKPEIHYGNIASSNRLIKNSLTRDELSKELGVLCFEMEAAGLMSDFPCLVIRGMCDYADSHMNKQWQKYAAGTAAGFAKELLSKITADLVRQEKAIQVLGD